MLMLSNGGLNLRTSSIRWSIHLISNKSPVSWLGSQTKRRESKERFWPSLTLEGMLRVRDISFEQNLQEWPDTWNHSQQKKPKEQGLKRQENRPAFTNLEFWAVAGAAQVERSQIPPSFAFRRAGGGGTLDSQAEATCKQQQGCAQSPSQGWEEVKTCKEAPRKLSQQPQSPITSLAPTH